MSARKQVVFDPAVLAAVTDGTRRQARRTLTPGQRRQAQRDAARERVTLELNPELMHMVRDIAVAEGISPAGAINALLADAIGHYVAGSLDFQDWLRPSRSPRFLWVVELQGLDELSADLAGKIDKPISKGGV